MPKKNNKAPFGVATKRFVGLGYHPDLDPTGSMKKDKGKLGPGEYFPSQFPWFCRYKDNGSRWDHEARIEEFSQQLGFRNAHVLNERRFFASLGGPGNYDVPEALFKQQSNNKAQGTGFGKQPRFFTSIKTDQPPPGTYGKNIAEQSIMRRKQMTPVPMFEWDGFVKRFKDKSLKWSLPSNRYDVVDGGSMDALTRKVVSKRGPYDLFTGPRTNSNIHNHFSEPKDKGPDKFYTWPTELDLLLRHPSKRRYGRFLHANRFPKYPTTRMMIFDLSMCYKNPHDPGPATYDVKSDGIRQLPDTKYPFNNSALEARKGTQWTILPGPGRYNLKPMRCMKKKKVDLSWCFKSETKREVYKVEKYSYF